MRVNGKKISDMFLLKKKKKNSLRKTKEILYQKDECYSQKGHKGTVK